MQKIQELSKGPRKWKTIAQTMLGLTTSSMAPTELQPFFLIMSYSYTWVSTPSCTAEATQITSHLLRI